MKHAIAIVVLILVFPSAAGACSCAGGLPEDGVKAAEYTFAKAEYIFFGTVNSVDLMSRDQHGRERLFWVTVHVDRAIKGATYREIVNFVWVKNGCGYGPTVGGDYTFQGEGTYLDNMQKPQRSARSLPQLYPLVLNPEKKILNWHGCRVRPTISTYDLAVMAEPGRKIYLDYLRQLQKLAHKPE